MSTKEKFVYLCSLIYLSRDGFRFPYEQLDHDPELCFIRNVNEYKLIVSKMSNFIDLINTDFRNISKDIEAEIYDSI